MRYLVLSCLLLAVMPAIAAPPFGGVDAGVHLQLAGEYDSPGRNRMLPERQRPKVGNQQAAARVKQVYADHKILSVQLIEAKGSPVYRVKTLSDDGVVKYVFVDGASGDVFE